MAYNITEKLWFDIFFETLMQAYHKKTYSVTHQLLGLIASAWEKKYIVQRLAWKTKELVFF